MRYTCAALITYEQNVIVVQGLPHRSPSVAALQLLYSMLVSSYFMLPHKAQPMSSIPENMVNSIRLPLKLKQVSAKVTKNLSYALIGAVTINLSQVLNFPCFFVFLLPQRVTGMLKMAPFLMLPASPLDRLPGANLEGPAALCQGKLLVTTLTLFHLPSDSIIKH